MGRIVIIRIYTYLYMDRKLPWGEDYAHIFEHSWQGCLFEQGIRRSKTWSETRAPVSEAWEHANGSGQ